MTADNNHHDPVVEGAAEEDLPQPPRTDTDAAETDEPLISPRGEEEPVELADADADVNVDAEALTPEELREVVTLAAKADEYLALAQRKQAEFENFRKRAAREATAARERGATSLAKELLPAVDNLERALQHAPEDDDEHGFVAGVRHVHADIVAALQRAGIEQFSPDGEPFDPTLHEAVAQQPIEGADSGTVVEVYQRGYRAGETVVRPARVVVAA